MSLTDLFAGALRNADAELRRSEATLRGARRLFARVRTMFRG